MVRDGLKGAVMVAVMLAMTAQSVVQGQQPAVNIDFEAGIAADTAHVGDDGALSNPGGTFWNSVVSGADTNDLRDEFGNLTPFDVAFLGFAGGQSFTDAGINNLQDSGTDGTFQIRGLLPGGVYTIAGYVGTNGGFSVTDNSGFIDFFGFGDPAADGWSLPGTLTVKNGTRGDYILVSGLVPFDTGGGSYGIEFGLDGTVTGFQISGPIPEPSCLALAGVGGLIALRRRR